MENKEVIILTLMTPAELESSMLFNMLMKNDLILQNENNNDNGVAVASLDLEDEATVVSEEEGEVYFSSSDPISFFDSIEEYYNKYNWTEQMLMSLVEKGYITEEECKKIINGE